MDEKVIVAFTKWMQTKDKQLAQVPTEQLAQQVVKALQTEEGQKQLQPLFQQFQTEMQGGMFKRGGKMDQAVKKMSDGGDTLNTRRQKEVLEYSRVPSKDYHEIVGDGNYIYKKIDGEWHENMPDGWDRDTWSPVEGEKRIAELDRLAAGSPSTLYLNSVRSKLGEFHEGKVVDGAHYVLKTMPAKITKAEAIEDVLNGIDYRKPESWYKNGIDSVVVRTDNPRFPRTASNRDLSVQLYRNNPTFRKVADFVGFTPAFERWKVAVKKDGGSIDRKQAKENKDLMVVTESGTFADGNGTWERKIQLGDTSHGRKLAKALATKGFSQDDFDFTREFDRADFRKRKADAREMGMNRHQRRAYALSELNRGSAPSAPTVMPEIERTIDLQPVMAEETRVKVFPEEINNMYEYVSKAEPLMVNKYPLRPEYHPAPSQYEILTQRAKNGTLGTYFSSIGEVQTAPKQKSTKDIQTTSKQTPSKKAPKAEGRSWRDLLKLAFWTNDGYFPLR